MVLRHRLPLLAAGLLLTGYLAPQSAWAKTYRWLDHNGDLQFTHTAPPPNAKKVFRPGEPLPQDERDSEYDSELRHLDGYSEQLEVQIRKFIDQFRATRVYGDGRFWKVTPKRSMAHKYNEGYVLGTMHISGSDVWHYTSKIRDAILATNLFCTEIHPPAKPPPEIVDNLKFNRASASLLDYLSEDDIRKLEASFLYMDVSFHEMLRLKPTGAYAMLMFNGLREATQDEPIMDFALYEVAKQNGHALCALETEDEHWGIFTGLSQKEAALLLKDYARTLNAKVTMASLQLMLYRRNRIGELLAMHETASLMEAKTAKARFFERLIDDRNRIMARRMLKHLRTYRPVYAVGAMHLPGKIGVLNLLAEQGFKITPLEKADLPF